MCESGDDRREYVDQGEVPDGYFLDEPCQSEVYWAMEW